MINAKTRLRMTENDLEVWIDSILPRVGVPSVILLPYALHFLYTFVLGWWQCGDVFNASIENKSYNRAGKYIWWMIVCALIKHIKSDGQLCVIVSVQYSIYSYLLESFWI